MKKTQSQHFYSASAKASIGNQFFLQLVQDGLTRKELKVLIQKRPSLYQRFSDWLDKLPA